MTERQQFVNPEPEASPIHESDFEELLELQSSILGMAASSDDSTSLLSDLCLMAEKLTPESLASVMLYNKADNRLYVHAAPSIPQEAIDALNGLQVGMGSCGNAVYHNEAMYVCNTLEDNRWCETRNFAETFKISACWSMPVHNDANEVIGTFALSSFAVREPTNFQCKLLHLCASVVGILLQKEIYLEQCQRLEKESLRSEKLESIGVLAGGLAHDFNNLLGIVLGNIEMSSRIVDVHSKAQEYMTSATKASRRAAELTQQLLTFSKGGAPVKKLNDLKETVKDSAEFVLHGSGIAITFDEENCSGSRVLAAEIDSGQISQVIQNIVINARQAMKGGGEIKFSCHTSVLADGEKFQLKAGKYHEISIQDTGPGISAEMIDKIFDPYFTTKSKGSGLGLALSFSIIRKHDGYIHVESEEGAGTCFTIYIPASDDTPEKLDNNVISLKQKSARKGCVMVMDDQDMLHEVAEAMLEELDYDTLHASDGEEALTMYKDLSASGRKIDAIIMDLTIPGGMGGKEAVQEVLAFDKDAHVIVCSGYSNDSVMSRYQNYGFKGALCKPYDLDELENALSKI